MNIMVLFNVPSSTVESIVVTAFESGISYWADEAREICANDFAYEVHEFDEDGGDGVWHRFKRGDIERGIQRYVEMFGFGRFGEFEVENRCIVDGNIDSECADAVMQLAIFGDIIYG